MVKRLPLRALLRSLSLLFIPVTHSCQPELPEASEVYYSDGLANHPNLDHKLKDTNGTPLQMNISVDEIHAIAFLNTLTDYEMISDPKLSDPFKFK